MVVALLKLFFSGLTTISNFISFVVFKGGAYVLVLILQVLGVPGAGVNFLLSQFKEAVLKLFGLFFESVGEGLNSAASEGSVLVDKISAASSNVTAIVINWWKEHLAEEFSNMMKEIMKEALDAIKKIVDSSWDHFTDGVEYVFKYIIENPNDFFNFF